MEGRLQDLQFDFMPKKANQVYHIVGANWFKQWKAYVGIVDPEVEEAQEQKESPEAEKISGEQQAKENFKNISKKQKQK